MGHGKHGARRLGAERSPLAHREPLRREFGVDDHVKLVQQEVEFWFKRKFITNSWRK